MSAQATVRQRGTCWQKSTSNDKAIDAREYPRRHSSAADSPVDESLSAGPKNVSHADFRIATRRYRCNPTEILKKLANAFELAHTNATR